MSYVQYLKNYSNMCGDVNQSATIERCPLPFAVKSRIHLCQWLMKWADYIFVGAPQAHLASIAGFLFMDFWSSLCCELTTFLCAAGGTFGIYFHVSVFFYSFKLFLWLKSQNGDGDGLWSGILDGLYASNFYNFNFASMN